MRRKWICLLLAGVLALSVAACGNKEEDASASGSSASASASDASGSEADASGSAASDGGQSASGGGDASAAQGEDASAPQGASDASPASGSDASGLDAASDGSAAPAASARVEPGLYYNENEELYTFERAPYLELREDGTGVFRANTGFGELVEASGSWTASGGGIVLAVEQLGESEEFYGDSQAQLTFTVLDDSNLMYSGATYGLTHSGDVMTLEGAEVYTGPLPSQTPAATPSAQGGASGADASGVDASSADASDVSGASGADSSAAQLEENTDGVSVVQPGELPPHRMTPGESFIVAGVDLESIVYDTAYFKMTPMADTGQALFTALQEGQTSVGYALVPFDGVDGTFTEYPIKIAETALGLTLVLAIAGGSLVAGGVLGTVLFLFFKKRRETREERKLLAIEKKEQQKDANERKKEEKAANAEKKAADAEIKAEEAAKKKQAKADKKAVKAAQKQEKKAAKQAAAKEKKAHAVALKAEKAAKEADKAAEKAAKAAERVAQKAGKKAGDDEEPPERERPAPEAGDDEGEPGAE